MLTQIQESVNFIRSKTSLEPQVGVILGTGLGSLVNEITVETEITYESIPHFPLSTVESHSGKLIFGTLGGKKAVVMQGRFHYYEGYDLKQVTFPVRVMRALGVETLFISNACGSVNPEMKKGSLMLISDHIDLIPDNPLRGINHPELGPRFPDMSEPYSKGLIARAKEVAASIDIDVHAGVYTCVPGPNLETKAEYTYIDRIGGDVVGMSTVPEVLVAVHSGMKIMAVSVITDEGFGELEPLTVEDVIAVAMKAEPKMTQLMLGVISSV